MATLSAPTLQSLLFNVRTALNQPDPTNSFWKDEELITHINDGIRLYFTEVIQNNEGYFTTTTSLNIVSGTDTVALPSDCFKVRALYKNINDGKVMLPYRNNVTEGYNTTEGNSGPNYFPYYYFQSNNLVLRPTPNFSETSGLYLEYVQFPTVLVDGGDSMTVQVSPVFKQLIEMYAIYKAKLKESMVNGVVVHKIAEEALGGLLSQFRDSIKNRSTNPTYVIPYNPENM
jgi:hypothetical protein